jgi:4-hydroxyphenylpyruvate dioxygenase
MEPLVAQELKQRAATDFLPLLGTDYLELYVGNAKQAAYYYKAAFGFQTVAYAGPETGVRDRASYVVQQGKIRLVLTTALHSDHVIADHVRQHGDGVKVLALWVDDAYASYEQTMARGARSYQEPRTLRDEHGEVRTAGIYTYATAKQCTSLWSAKTTAVPFCPVTSPKRRPSTPSPRACST